MSTVQCATESGLPDPANESLAADSAKSSHAGSSRVLPGLVIGFTTTIMLALGLACWYLRERIEAANPVAPAHASSLAAGQEKQR